MLEDTKDGYLARDWQQKTRTLMGVCRYAYVEFTEPSLVSQALVLNDSIFRGRSLKVTRQSIPTQTWVVAKGRLQVVPKRTNLPGLARGARGGRGRGGPPPPAYGRSPYGAPPPPRGYYGPPGGGYGAPPPRGG